MRLGDGTPNKKRIILRFSFLVVRWVGSRFFNNNGIMQCKNFKVKKSQNEKSEIQNEKPETVLHEN